jgi:hypothetical protein
VAPERLIDVPLESLPFVDQHVIGIRADPGATWDALLDVVRGMGTGRQGPRISRALGAFYTEVEGEPGEVGSTVPGFVVARSIPPGLLALMGQHRYSRYALIFSIVESAEGNSELSAETRAEFPGLQGEVYKTLVIRSRGHVLATRHILTSVRKRAERGG